MGESVRVAREVRGAIVILRVEETQILADRAETFRLQLLNAIPAEHARVAMDLAKVDFFDSSGIGVLVSIVKAVRPEGDLVLFAVRPSVREILRLTHLDSIFPCAGDEAAALAALGTAAHRS